jgi:flavodoxin I
MAKIGMFYGTQTGKTEEVAEAIRAKIGESIVDIYNVAEIDLTDFDGYEYLIIGSPTWNIGELQVDWDGLFPELDQVNFQGKTVAYFGTGDQVGYADNFMDAIGILEAKISELGGKTVGQWPTEGYDFSESQAVRSDRFVGLAIDEDNQPELTAGRIDTWVRQIKPEFGI